MIKPPLIAFCITQIVGMLIAGKWSLTQTGFATTIYISIIVALISLAIAIEKGKKIQIIYWRITSAERFRVEYDKGEYSSLMTYDTASTCAEIVNGDVVVQYGEIGK